MGEIKDARPSHQDDRTKRLCNDGDAFRASKGTFRNTSCCCGGFSDLMEV
jgi:hypothetical protein